MIDIVIVSWNCRALLSDCLDSIADSGAVASCISSVVVVDNASEETIEDVVAKHSEFVTFVRNETNLGFAKACNIGAGLGCSEFVLFLNPDTRIEHSLIQGVLRAAESPEASSIGIFGVPVESESGESVCGSVFPTLTTYASSLIPSSVATKLRIRKGALLCASDIGGGGCIDQVIGAFFFVRRSLFEKLEGFDERFFVYFEEVDFCYRSKMLGYKSYIVPGPSMYHYGGGSSEAVRGLRLFYSLRSRLIYSRKHLSFIHYSSILVFTFSAELMARVFYAILGRRFRDVPDIIFAYLKCFRFFKDQIF